MQIASVVILFFPDEIEVVKNIQSYLPFVDYLYIIDNTPLTNLKVHSFCNSLVGSAEYIKNDKNEGVAASLNKALALSAMQGYEWLLTMDQDSYFEEKQAKEYFNQFEKQFYNSTTVSIVCPNHSDNFKYNQDTFGTKEINACITSGSLINVKICNQLNGFDEKLFIDEVDMEYGYRCVLAGYKIIQFPNIQLTHQLGTKVNAGYFSLIKRSNRSIHSPFRVYFIVRNYLYVSSKYAQQLPGEFKVRKKGFYVILKNNLLFSGKFFTVMAAIIKGYLHFKMNNFSNKVVLKNT